jgi:hypothetical protein
MIHAALLLRLVRDLVPSPYPGETPDGYRARLHEFCTANELDLADVAVVYRVADGEAIGPEAVSTVASRPPVFTERPTQ